jgi:hypothetical protein
VFLALESIFLALALSMTQWHLQMHQRLLKVLWSLMVFLSLPAVDHLVLSSHDKPMFYNFLYFRKFQSLLNVKERIGTSVGTNDEDACVPFL